MSWNIPVFDLAGKIKDARVAGGALLTASGMPIIEELIAAGTINASANFIIPLGTGTWDGGSGGFDVQPGDIIEIAAGVRGGLRINNVNGVLGNRILIRSDPAGITTFRNSPIKTDDFVLRLDDCTHFDLDGSYTTGETYGLFIKTTLSGDGPSAYLKFQGLCSDFTCRFIEIDGDWPTLGINGIGISLNQANVTQTLNPGIWRENVIVENCYIRRCEGEGMYLGPNYYVDGSLKDELDCRNMTVRFNIVEDCGWNAIDCKSWIEGTNRIYGNVVKRCGNRVDANSGQHNQITVLDGSADIYDNYVEDSGEHGISINQFRRPATLFGPFSAKIYNNVIWKTGLVGPFDGNGITIARSAASAQPGNVLASNISADIYNNTIVTVNDRGIVISNDVTESGNIKDNILVDITNADIDGVGSYTETNNRTGTIAAQNFVDAANGDFHLTSSSPARDSGSASGFPATDFDGVGRPQESDADQGAYEFLPDRGILSEFIFSNGGIRSAVNADGDGIYRDFGFVFGAMKWDSPITITDITNTNPAVATFTGSMPDKGIGAAAYMDTPGFTLGEITSGMTELSGRLIRPKNISGNTFDVYQDGDDAGYNPGQDVLGNTAVDATGYGTWSGSVSAQAYKKVDNDDQSLWWDIGSDDYPNLRVVAGSFTPPDTINGSANAVSPLEGANFLSHQVNYWIDHSRDPANTSGNWNNDQNKPRNQLIWSNSNTKVPDNETIWMGISIFLPSNFDNTTITRDDDLAETQLFEIEDDPSVQQRNLVLINIARNSADPSGIMSWVLDAALGGTNDSITEEIKLEVVAGDIGLWTSFVVKVKRHATLGIMQIWKSTGAYLGGANPLDRAMHIVYDRTNQPVGFTPTFANWGFGLKQYKHAWHHHTGTGDSKEQWIGYDSIRWGTEETHGTDFSSVHPFRRVQP